MGNKKRKPQKKKQKKKADITVQKSGSSADVTYTQSDVKKLEPVTEEKPVEVKQPFTDPTLDVIPITMADSTEASSGDVKLITQPEVLAHKVLEREEAEINTLYEAIAELPEALLAPTQRQYTTEFRPTYSKVRNKLRKLAGL